MTDFTSACFATEGPYRMDNLKDFFKGNKGFNITRAVLNF